MDRDSDWDISCRTGRLFSTSGTTANRRNHRISAANDPILPLTFGVLYFLSNCPFYLLAWKRFGARFAFNSAISGALVSIFADHLAMLITLEKVNVVYCAVAGGLLMGLGMLILFRHRSSLGGFNVLCLFIQDRFGISVGKSQMAIDGLILLASFFLFLH